MATIGYKIIESLVDEVRAAHGFDHEKTPRTFAQAVIAIKRHYRRLLAEGEDFVSALEHVTNMPRLCEDHDVAVWETAIKDHIRQSIRPSTVG